MSLFGTPVLEPRVAVAAAQADGARRAAALLGPAPGRRGTLRP